MDAIYGTNAVSMATVWVCRECSARDPVVGRMCKGPWGDAIATLRQTLQTREVFQSRQKSRHSLVGFDIWLSAIPYKQRWQLSNAPSPRLRRPSA